MSLDLQQFAIGVSVVISEDRVGPAGDDDVQGSPLQ